MLINRQKYHFIHYSTKITTLRTCLWTELCSYWNPQSSGSPSRSCGPQFNNPYASQYVYKWSLLNPVSLILVFVSINGNMMQSVSLVFSRGQGHLSSIDLNEWNVLHTSSCENVDTLRIATLKPGMCDLLLAGRRSRHLWILLFAHFNCSSKHFVFDFCCIFCLIFLFLCENVFGREKKKIFQYRIQMQLSQVLLL